MYGKRRGRAISTALLLDLDPYRDSAFQHMLLTRTRAARLGTRRVRRYAASSGGKKCARPLSRSAGWDQTALNIIFSRALVLEVYLHHLSVARTATAPGPTARPPLTARLSSPYREGGAFLSRLPDKSLRVRLLTRPPDRSSGYFDVVLLFFPPRPLCIFLSFSRPPPINTTPIFQDINPRGL